MAEVWTPPAKDDIATDEFVTAAQLNAFGNSLRYLSPVVTTIFEADVSVTGTTEGAATSVVSTGAISYDAGDYVVEFFSPSSRPDNGAASRTMTIVLYDSTTALGWLSQLITPAAANCATTVHAIAEIPLTAASHTINVKAFVNTITGLIRGNTGGSGTLFPGFLKVSRVVPPL